MSGKYTLSFVQQPPKITPNVRIMRTIEFFGLRPGRYRHSDYLAGRDSHK
jgi:hypothetical protein